MAQDSAQTMRHIDFKTPGKKERPRVKNYYLVVIGIDHYKNGVPPLKNPVKDAGLVATTLTRKYLFEGDESAPDLKKTDPAERYADDQRFPVEIPVFKTNRTICLYNENASKRNISDTLTGIYDAIGPDDALLIYCAGHGHYDKMGKTFFFIPAGGNNNDLDTYLNIETLYKPYSDYLNDKKCRHFLLILDCCFSGTAALGFKKKSAQYFSRDILTSTWSDQPAADGYDGSCFAKALARVLDSNWHDYSSIDEDLLSERFNEIYEMDFDGEHSQNLLYDTLPLDIGEGKFIFELKEKEIPPIDVLSDMFIKHLNFFSQKAAFKTHYGAGGNKDCLLISTVCKNINIHKLQGKVLFSELHQRLVYEEKFKFEPRFGSITVHPDKTDLKPWEALAATLNIPVSASVNIKTECVNNICGRLMRDDKTRKMIEPLIIIWGCNFQSKEQSDGITLFSKELFSSISDFKANPDNKEKKFDRLVLMIADTRDGVHSFLTRENLAKEIGPLSLIIAAEPVSDLNDGVALDWYLNAQKAIRATNFLKLSMEEYYKNCSCYDIEDFILKVSGDLSVDKTKLQEILWYY